MNNNGWSNNLYAAYGVKKGLDFIGVKLIDTPWGTRLGCGHGLLVSGDRQRVRRQHEQCSTDAVLRIRTEG